MKIARAAALCLLASVAARAQGTGAVNASDKAGAQRAWRFAVSGDSRNCGDIVMPSIAAAAKAVSPLFYWHLGDFRWNSNVDEDLQHDSARGGKPLDKAEYARIAWQDFIDSQVKPFSPVRVLLSIGNHELYGKTRADYLTTFRPWIAQPGEQHPRTYYHWTHAGVDFISLDNATHDQFDAAQMSWFDGVLKADLADARIKTIVVGMHAALPDSISFGHSMSESTDPVAVQSGRKVYQALLGARNKAHKRVYVLASHSHFFMEGTFNTPYWRAHGGELPGWIVGTAGAVRYPLPPAAKNAKRALTKVYGFLIGTVDPKTGSIRFTFQRIEKADVPAAVASRYGKETVDFCFDKNASEHQIGPKEPH